MHSRSLNYPLVLRQLADKLERLDRAEGFVETLVPQAWNVVGALAEAGRGDDPAAEALRETLARYPVLDPEPPERPVRAGTSRRFLAKDVLPERPEEPEWWEGIWRRVDAEGMHLQWSGERPAGAGWERVRLISEAERARLIDGVALWERVMRMRDRFRETETRPAPHLYGPKASAFGVIVDWIDEELGKQRKGD